MADAILGSDQTFAKTAGGGIHDAMSNLAANIWAKGGDLARDLNVEIQGKPGTGMTDNRPVGSHDTQGKPGATTDHPAPGPNETQGKPDATTDHPASGSNEPQGKPGATTDHPSPGPNETEGKPGTTTDHSTAGQNKPTDKPGSGTTDNPPNGSYETQGKPGAGTTDNPPPGPNELQGKPSEGGAMTHKAPGASQLPPPGEGAGGYTGMDQQQAGGQRPSGSFPGSDGTAPGGQGQSGSGQGGSIEGGLGLAPVQPGYGEGDGGYTGTLNLKGAAQKPVGENSHPITSPNSTDEVSHHGFPDLSDFPKIGGISPQNDLTVPVAAKSVDGGVSPIQADWQTLPDLQLHNDR